MSTQLIELANQRDAKANEVKALLDEYRDGNGGFKAIPADVRDKITSLKAEVDDLGTKHDELAIVERTDEEIKGVIQSLNEPRYDVPFPSGGGKQGDRRQVKSLGQMFVESAAYKSAKSSGMLQGSAPVMAEIPDFSMKATITTSAGFAPPNFRTPDVVPFANRLPMLADYIPQTETSLETIKYMEQTTFTNATAGTAENAALSESSLVWTERSQQVELLGTYVPVTDQQVQDVPTLQDLVDSDLLLMLMLKEEVDLLSGNGSTPNLLGFYNKSGIQTQAKGADDVPSAIHKAMTKVRHTGFANPSLVVMHPNDWQDVRLLKDANGNFIWGSPADEGVSRIWGVPVVATTAATENTGLLGDFTLYSRIYRNKGALVEIGYINDDFTKNKKTVKITERLALVIRRAAAFCTITGI